MTWQSRKRFARAAKNHNLGGGTSHETDQTVPKTIDEYIAGFPQDVQAILQEVRRTIHEAAPDAEEKISYQMPTFWLNGNLVHLGGFKKHIGFYPTPSGTAGLSRSWRLTSEPRLDSSFPWTADPVRPDPQDRRVSGAGESGQGEGKGKKK